MAQTKPMKRKVQEAGCFALLTHVPTQGEMAHSAGEILRAYQAQHGVEQNFAFLKDPVTVNGLFLKKPEWIEALGLVLLLALLLWRLVERTLEIQELISGLCAHPLSRHEEAFMEEEDDARQSHRGNPHGLKAELFCQNAGHA